MNTKQQGAIGITKAIDYYNSLVRDYQIENILNTKQQGAIGITKAIDYYNSLVRDYQ